LFSAACGPGGKQNILNGADGLACAVIISSVPFCFSSRSISLDIFHACAYDLNQLELPVRVSPEGLDEAFLVIILIINKLVLWIVMAGFSVHNGLRSELLNSCFDIRPVMVLKLLDESICIIGHCLVRCEACVDHRSHIHTKGSVEDTGLEICRGSGWNSSVLSHWGVPPGGKGELLNGADGLACAVIISSVPFGCSILNTSLDICHVWKYSPTNLDLPVRVSFDGLDDGFLMIPLIINILVCRIVMADISVCFDLRSELLYSCHDSRPVFGLKRRDKSICIIGQGLVWFEAFVDVRSHIYTKGSVEDTGLEICDSSVWNSSVLSDL